MERNHLSNFGKEAQEELFCEIILKMAQRFRRKCHLKKLLTPADHNSSPWPFWISDGHDFSSFRSKSYLVATEQVSAQSDVRFGRRCRKLIFKMAAVVAILDFCSAQFSLFCVSTRHPDTPHQVSTQLDHRGDVQNMNSQHFFHKMYRAHTNAWGSKCDLAT